MKDIVVILWEMAGGKRVTVFSAQVQLEQLLLRSREALIKRGAMTVVNRQS